MREMALSAAAPAAAGAVGRAGEARLVARAGAGQVTQTRRPRIRFAVIGINHNHILHQVDAVLARWRRARVVVRARAGPGGRLSSGHSHAVALARSEDEASSRIDSIHLVVSAAIPDERAPLGLRVMQHGKDYMADKPGVTTLEQLAEVRQVQAATGRIYSIIYQRAVRRTGQPWRAGELVQAGAIGPIVQTVGLGPHRMNAHESPRLVLRQGPLRRHPLRHRVAPGRPVPVSSPRSTRAAIVARRRLATSTTRQYPGSRTSANLVCAAIPGPATSASTGSRPTGCRPGVTGG